MSDLGAGGGGAGGTCGGGGAPTPLNSALASCARSSSGAFGDSNLGVVVGGADRPAGSPHVPPVLLSLISPLGAAAVAAIPRSGAGAS
mmetsp:Transcript_12901/g.54630  ORF Transcript_12901/g.54630 Transcript_12901/m.54630 type:complete len:88 (+) Transcript_12901:443-706(+)